MRRTCKDPDVYILRPEGLPANFRNIIEAWGILAECSGKGGDGIGGGGVRLIYDKCFLWEGKFESNVGRAEGEPDGVPNDEPDGGPDGEPTAGRTVNEADMPAPATVPRTGQMAPDFRLTDHRGESLALSDLRGKLVAVNFIYTRCPMSDVCPRLAASFATGSAAISSSGIVR